MALMVGAAVGFAAGLLIAAPWAGGRGEDVCRPAQTVSDQILEQVQWINRKLDNAIEDEPNLSLPELRERTAKIANGKHLLIHDFPPVFAHSALDFYLDLETIDKTLESAYEAKGRKGGNPRDHLRAAQRARDSLEEALRQSPCRPR
jgi:hypothetical protein